MKSVLKLIVFLLMTNISFAQAWYFEYQSQGTYYPYGTVVSFRADGKVDFTKTHLHTQRVYEKWEATIEKEVLDIFLKELMNNCRFFDLPESSGEPIRIKDSSYDYFTLIYRDKKHTIGGYGASHDKVYATVYAAYNSMWGKMKNIKVLTDPKNE